MAKKKLKAAILGFGGMGHCHASQYTDAQKDVELVACCDIDPKQFERTDVALNFGSSGQSDTKLLRKYLSYEELVENEKDNVDIIDICLPSYLHCEYAVRAMQDGFHVLCEKPMALNTEDCRKMIRASEKTGKQLMVAQCIRFDNSFLVIKEAYDSGKYGKLLRLSTHRMAGLPGRLWFRDVKLSGGAMMDLHIHDLDFFQYMLGIPESLICYGINVFSGGIDDSVTNYVYRDGTIVTSEGSWARDKWSCAMTAIFENGTIRVEAGEVFLYQKDKPVKKLKYKAGNCYFNEIAYFARCVKTGAKPEKALPESTLNTIRLIELEQKSALAGGRKIRI